MNTLIKNAYIVDGTGTKGYLAMISLKGSIIEKIDKKIPGNFEKVIDAKGYVLCPGFIDTHSHSDLEILINPYIKAKIAQGITTEVLGQDGISMAPLPVNYLDDWRKNLAGLDGDSDNIDWTYKTTDGYFKLIEESGLGLNAAYLVPHGNIRMEAVGLDNRAPTLKELDLMKEILRREMESGAIGLSTGLIYIPCAYSKTEELIELCKVVSEYNGVFAVHQRSEADDIITSLDEIMRIGETTGVKVHFSHFKICGRKNWNKIVQIIEMIETAETHGVKISFDQYPYTAGSTMLGVILPPWVHDGGTAKLLEKLKSNEVRKRIRKDIEEGIPGWDNFIDFAGFDGIFITSVKSEKNRDLIGKSLVDIGKKRAKDPLEAAFDLIIEEENAVGMVDFYGSEQHIKQFLKRKEQNVCTDGLLGGKPHPRAYGAFPRVLGKYVREEKILTLEEAVSKMTYKAANVFGFKDRGLIKEGFAADIVIFDPDTVSDKGTYTDPVQYPEGIKAVIINGEIVLEDGKFIEKFAGEVIRR